MKITAVEPQKKNSHRFSIYLDGQFAFGADEDLVVERRLVVGKEIAAEDLEKILFEAEVGKLMERMYGLFGRRQRSEKETRDYMRMLNYKLTINKKEPHSELVIESLVNKLKLKQLINDEEFARAWVDARRKSKKKGKIALKSELFQKGISKEIINDELSIINEEDEEKLAQQALEKKLKSWHALPKLEFKKKAYEFLMRRGFDYSTVKEVVEKIIKKP